MAGEVLDLSNIGKKQHEVLMGHLMWLIQSSFNNQEQDDRREAVDRAIRQEFQGNDFGVNNFVHNEKFTRFDAETDERLDGFDEFSPLYVPLILSLYRTWTTHMKNAVFPANGDWVDINRKNSIELNQLGLKEFLPYANDAWVKILKTENQRFSFKEKYSTAIAEMVAYGNTGLIHFYDKQNNYVDVRVPGIRDVAIYPVTDRWEESNLVVRCDVNYSDLKERADFNQEYVDYMKPSRNGLNTWSDQDYGRGSTKQHEHEEYFVPYGKVRLFDIYIPSLYLEDPENENEPIEGTGLYFTVAYQPDVKDTYHETDLNHGHSSFILKASKNVDKTSHGIRLGVAGTTLPGVFYHQGMLAPFLTHQLTINQMFSGIARTTALIMDPPLSLKRLPDADFETTPPKEFVSGALYEGYEVDVLVPQGYYQALPQFLQMAQYITNAVETGSGVTRQQQGGQNVGRRSATEVKEANSGGQMNIVEASNQFDEQVLQPSVTNRIQLTQRILREEVEADPAFEVAPDSVLETNELFQRLLEFSGIDEHYEEFYKKRQNDILKDKNLLLEIEGMMQEIISLQQFADSDIAPFQAPQVQIDPLTGQEIGMTEAEIMQMAQQYEQEQEAQRQQAIQQVKQLQLQVEAKNLQINGYQEIPEPSLALYYTIFTHPIKDSDIIVTGSQSTLSKDLTRQSTALFMEALQAMPPDVQQKIDYERILARIAKTNNLPLMDVKRDEADIRKAEEAAAKQAELEQSLAMQAAQVPGAQPPKL